MSRNFDLPGKSGKLKNWLENQGKYGITHRWVENVPVQISDTFQNYKQHLKCVDEKKIKSQNVEIMLLVLQIMVNGVLSVPKCVAVSVRECCLID